MPGAGVGVVGGGAVDGNGANLRETAAPVTIHGRPFSIGSPFPTRARYDGAVPKAQVLATSTWPVLLMVCPRRIDAAWIEEVQADFRDVFARERRFALVTDTSAIESVPGARERKMLGEWAGRADQLALQKQFNVGSATIITSPLIRGMLQALHWIWTPATPQHVSADFDGAWTWCARTLEERGVLLGAPADELRAKAEQEVRRTHAANEARATTSPRA